MSFALFALSLSYARPAQAQGGYPGGGSGYPGSSGWVPSDGAGNPLSSSSNGSAPMVPGVIQADDKSTYDKIIPNNAPDFWFAVFSPNSHDSGDGSDGYYTTTLFLSSNADNSILNTPYGHAVGTYAPDPWDPGEWSTRMGSSTPWPDLIGTVHGDHKAPLTAHFVWTGPGPAPDANFLVRTHLGATAGGDYGTSGKTSGLSATGMALVPSFGEQVTASLTNSTSDSASLDGLHLVRVSGAGGLATVTFQANVTTDTGNSLPFSQWSDGGADGGTSYYNYMGDLNGRTSATATASVSATANYDSRGVDITCPAIEDSFYKGTYDSQHSTDRYQHIHQPSGNSVDSVVFQQNDPSIGQHFVAGHTYDSNAVNFTSPVFNWTISGDGNPDSDTSANLSPNPSNPYGLANLPANLDFGATWDTTQTKSSQISVDIKDEDGADATDTYSVTWHAPQEKFTVLSYQKDVPRLVGGLQPITVNASIPSYLTIPGQEGQIDWGDVQQQAGLPVAVAGAGAGGLLLIPEVAAGPAGWVVIGAQAVAAGASYKLGTSSPDHPGTVQIQGNADYNEYLADLNHQVAINSDPNAAGDLVRFNPPLLASQAQAAEMDPAHWTSDPYFMSCTAEWQGGWYTDIKDLDGDGYDVHGYVGHVPGHTEVATHLFKYFVWTCTYRPPA